jgi:ankyrin repeat protein
MLTPAWLMPNPPQYRPARRSGRRHTGVAIMLVDHGADVTAVDVNGWTPLRLATESGDQEAVSCLRAHGAL